MRALEFALATLVISIFEIGYALWVATMVGNRITELFESIINALP